MVKAMAKVKAPAKTEPKPRKRKKTPALTYADERRVIAVACVPATRDERAKVKVVYERIAKVFDENGVFHVLPTIEYEYIHDLRALNELRLAIKVSASAEYEIRERLGEL